MAMPTSLPTINIVPKQNTTSLIWTYFGLEADEDGKPVSTETVRCQTCYAPVPGKGGNTSNSFSHLKNHHPKKYKEVMDAVAAANAAKQSSSSSSKSSAQATQPTLENLIEKSKQYGKKWQALTDSVTKCITMDMMPIYTVEKEGFRRMLKTFDPRYELPGRKYFSNTAIPSLYTEVRARVAKELEESNYFSATTDMWSSSTGEPIIYGTLSGWCMEAQDLLFTSSVPTRGPLS